MQDDTEMEWFRSLMLHLNEHVLAGRSTLDAHGAESSLGSMWLAALEWCNQMDIDLLDQDDRKAFRVVRNQFLSHGFAVKGGTRLRFNHINQSQYLPPQRFYSHMLHQLGHKDFSLSKLGVGYPKLTDGIVDALRPLLEPHMARPGELENVLIEIVQIICNDLGLLHVIHEPTSGIGAGPAASVERWLLQPSLRHAHAHRQARPWLNKNNNFDAYLDGNFTALDGLLERCLEFEIFTSDANRDNFRDALRQHLTHRSIQFTSNPTSGLSLSQYRMDDNRSHCKTRHVETLCCLQVAPSNIAVGRHWSGAVRSMRAR